MSDPEPQTPNDPQVPQDPASHEPAVSPAPGRMNFRRAMRLSGSAAFSAVFEAKMRKNAGPLSVLTRPNALRFSRLGLSVSRKVGNAVKRNRVKRRLREAFRLQQHELPPGYDVVIVVRPHRPLLPMADYARLLRTALDAADTNWRRRHRSAGSENPAAGQ